MSIIATETVWTTGGRIYVSRPKVKTPLTATAQPPDPAFKGVYPQTNNRWRARICVDGIRSCLGNYNTVEEAATAYGLAAVLFFGEFARMSWADWVNEKVTDNKV